MTRTRTPSDSDFDSGIYPTALPFNLDFEPTCDRPDCGCEFSTVARAEADESADAHRDEAIEHQAERTAECPTCHGHGDVPTGRYSPHNPTGLDTCPRCKGDRVVPCDARGEGPHVEYDLTATTNLRARAV